MPRPIPLGGTAPVVPPWLQEAGNPLELPSPQNRLGRWDRPGRTDPRPRTDDRQGLLLDVRSVLDLDRCSTRWWPRWSAFCPTAGAW